MSHDSIIAIFTARAQTDPRVAALLLGGSLGAGTGDAFSDVDLILVAQPEHHGVLAAEARAWGESVGDLVIWKAPYPGVPLFTAVTAAWERFDLTVTVPGRVTGSRAGLRPLVDRELVWESLPERLEPKPIAPDRLAGIIEETYRILGLLPLGMGREEYVVGVTGAGLLRDNLITLMVAQTEPALQPGALSLRRLLPREDMTFLERQPGIAPTRDSVIAASLTYGGQALARARMLAGKVGVAWPDALEAACRDRLRRELELELP